MQSGLLDMMAQAAAQQRTSIRAEAQQQADTITAEAQEAAKHRHDEAVAQLKSQLEFQEKRARMVAEAEAERETLSVQQSVSKEVLRQAADELASVAASQQFSRILEVLLAQLMVEAPDDAIVTVPAQHLTACQAWLKSHGHERKTVEGSESLTDGVSIRDRNHTYRMTNSLSSRMALLDREIRKRCHVRLFGEDT